MDWAQLLASVVLVVATVVLAWATLRYTTATERMAVAVQQQVGAATDQAVAAREQATAALAQAESARPRPYVHLFMQSQHSTVGLRNIGQRVAHNVTVEIHKDHFVGATAWLGQEFLFKAPIPSIAPGAEAKDSFMYGVILPASSAEVDVTVRYSDAEGRIYSERVYALVATYADWFHNRPLGGPNVPPPTPLGT